MPLLTVLLSCILSMFCIHVAEVADFGSITESKDVALDMCVFKRF
jgi:hypothetical protein